MPPRVTSPFKPARPALVEPIVQPIWSSDVLTVATPQSQLRFFPVPTASAGDPTRAFIADNKLANPKIAVIRGFRLHVAQDVTVPDTTGAKFKQLMEIAEQYWFRFFLGVKEYLRAPVFYMSSGVGVWLAPTAAGAEATNEFLYTATLGIPHRENYYKIARRPITIPPQQEFEADINRSSNASGAISGANVRIYFFAEADLGREVM